MTKIVSLVALPVALCLACSNPKSSATDTAASTSVRANVQSTTAAFHEALRMNDSAAFFSHVDNDVVLMPPGEQAVRGVTALQSWYSGFLSQYTTSSLTLSDKEVFVGDGWATEVGRYDWGLKPTSGGPEVVDHGHYMQVWKKQPDGQWKFYREIWNSSTPAS